VVSSCHSRNAWWFRNKVVEEKPDGLGNGSFKAWLFKDKAFTRQTKIVVVDSTRIAWLHLLADVFNLTRSTSPLPPPSPMLSIVDDTRFKLALIHSFSTQTYKFILNSFIHFILLSFLIYGAGLVSHQLLCSFHCRMFRR